MTSKPIVFKNLYLVKRTSDFIHCDQYYDFVICCENEDEARLTHPDEDCTDEWSKCGHDNEYDGWVNFKNVDTLKVTFLGQANMDIKKGVICSSFFRGY